MNKAACFLLTLMFSYPAYALELNGVGAADIKDIISSIFPAPSAIKEAGINQAPSSCEAAMAKSLDFRQTAFRDGKGEPLSGFEAAYYSESGPMPVSLVLRTENEAYYYHQDCDICAAVDKCDLKTSKVSNVISAHSITCQDLAPYAGGAIYSACAGRSAVRTGTIAASAVSIGGKSYTLRLSFNPEARPSAAAVTGHNYFEATEYGHGPAGNGVVVCSANANFRLGTVRLELLNEDGSPQGLPREAGVNMTISNSDWSGKDNCGVQTGPVTKEAYFYIDGLLSLDLKDPANAHWPLANMQLSLLNGIDAIAAAAGALATSDNGRTFQLTGLNPELLAKNMVVKLDLRRNDSPGVYYWAQAADIKF